MDTLDEEASTSSLSSPPESISDLQMGEITVHGEGAQTAEDGPSIDVELEAKESDSITVKTVAESDSIAVKSPDDHSATASPKSAVVARGRKRKAPVAPTKRVILSKKVKSEGKNWQAPFVYTDAKTPLAGSDLRAILLDSRAWDVLSDEEQKCVLELLPEHTHILALGTESARPNIGSLRNSDTFRFDSARYCESIEAGKHDPDWLHCAWVAHGRRNRGDFDEYQVKKFERGWSVRVSSEYHPNTLRNEGHPTSKDGPGNDEDPRTPEMTAVGTAEDAKAPIDREQFLRASELDSPCRSSFSVEKRIAIVNITGKGYQLAIPAVGINVAEKATEEPALEISNKT